VDQTGPDILAQIGGARLSPLTPSPPSSSGPGRRPFKAVTRVRIPLGVPRRSVSGGDGRRGRILERRQLRAPRGRQARARSVTPRTEGAAADGWLSFIRLQLLAESRPIPCTSRRPLRFGSVSTPGHLADIGGVGRFDRREGDAVGSRGLDLVSDPKIDGDGLSDAGQPGSNIVLVVGVVEDSEQRVSNRFAVLELHEDVTDPDSDLAVFVSRHLAADPLRQCDKGVGNRRAVVSQPEPRLNACRRALSTSRRIAPAARIAIRTRGATVMRGALAFAYSVSVSRSLAARIPQSKGGFWVKRGRNSIPGSGSSSSARSRSQSWVATAHTEWAPTKRSGSPDAPLTPPTLVQRCHSPVALLVEGRRRAVPPWSAADQKPRTPRPQRVEDREVSPAGIASRLQFLHRA